MHRLTPPTSRFLLVMLATAIALATRPVASAASVPQWHRLPMTSGTHYHSIVLDQTRQRMIVFGGLHGSTYSNDVLALPLNGPPLYERIEPAPGPRPAPRSGQTVVYDPLRDRLLVFGGNSQGGILSDVWQLSLSGTPQWTQLAPTGEAPAARWGHLAVYDPVRDRVVVFGGINGVTKYNDVWALWLSDQLTWTNLAPTGTPPAVRWGHAGIYDPTGDRLVIFGGTSLATPLADTWALSLGDSPDWTQLSPAGTPPPGRWSQAAAYDATRQRMVMFGGYNGTVQLGDTWSLDLSGATAWNAVSPGGSAPAARFLGTWVYDAPRDRCVLFGGGTSAGSVDDVWSLDLASGPQWVNEITASAPSAWRYNSPMVLDPVGQRVWMFGGFYNSTFFNDLLYLPLTGNPRWIPVIALGTPPPARHSHSATYDPVRKRIIVFGGISSSSGSRLNDVWELSLAGTPTWQQLSPSGTPPAPRHSHSAIYDPVRERLVVFGGSSIAVNFMNDVHALSLTGDLVWTALTPNGSPPSGRFEQGTIYDPLRDRMVICGGLATGGTNPSDMWSLSLSGPGTWTQQPTSANTFGSGHSAIYDPAGDRMLVFGGFVVSSTRNDVVETWLGPGGPISHTLSPLGTLPTARMSHSAVYDPDGARMLAYGGFGVDPAVDGSVWSLTLDPPTLSTPPNASSRGVLLAAARPDPAREDVSLGFTLPAAGRAQLRVYDVAGRCAVTLVDGALPAGPHSVRWDRRTSSGQRARAGLYFYELVAFGTKHAGRVVLID